MSRASQDASTRPPQTRAVVYLYTQTGQLREVTEALTAPLQADNWQLRWVDVRPREEFPFPWPIRRFFGVFPRATDPNGLVELAEPERGFASTADELVILAYQVWYLAPSVPVRSLLVSHPESVRGRDVIAVIACRNMWYSAAIEVCALLHGAGARSVEVVAATDTRSSATTLVTTLRWLLTGRRGPFLWFSRAGVGDDELARMAEVGRSIAAFRPRPAGIAPVVPGLAVADLLAGGLFRRWGAVVRQAGRRGRAVHAASLIAFVGTLATGLVIGLPLAALAEIVGGRRFATGVRGFVHARISFGRPAFSGVAGVPLTGSTRVSS